MTEKTQLVYSRKEKVICMLMQSDTLDLVSENALEISLNTIESRETTYIISQTENWLH
jgi:hypothetical protein